MSELATFGLGAASILSGLLVGLGAPLVASRQTRHAAASGEQRAIAGQILAIWEDMPDIVGPLTTAASPQRRNLLLLGVRLDDAHARKACLELVSLADSGKFEEDELLKAWTNMITAVAVVYRASA